MFLRERKVLASILDRSPFFSELSIKERELLIKDLLKTYPQLLQKINNDVEVGYEASWLMKKSN